MLPNSKNRNCSNGRQLDRIVKRQGMEGLFLFLPVRLSNLFTSPVVSIVEDAYCFDHSIFPFFSIITIDKADQSPQAPRPNIHLKKYFYKVKHTEKTQLRLIWNIKVIGLDNRSIYRWYGNLTSPEIAEKKKKYKKFRTIRMTADQSFGYLRADY